MVLLAGGTFRMGADEATLLAQFPTAGTGLKSMLRTETPAVEVTIPPFFMDRYEVTNAQFRRFVVAQPRWRKEAIGGNYLQDWSGNDFPVGRANYPVVFITWDAALAYAHWAGRRLSTEAEWEFAARGGRDTRYPWGAEDPNPRLTNFSASGLHAPTAVGSYPPNPYGLYDLAGNVWEFCMDPWQNTHAGVSQRQTEAGVRRMASAIAERRVIRGGSYDGGAFNMRVTARDGHPASNAVAFVGFRCATSV
jgi:formylglycine-generating enzyme required for sulfatase activity